MGELQMSVISEFLTLLDGQTFGTMALTKRSGSTGNLADDDSGDLPTENVVVLESDVADVLIHRIPRNSIEYTVVIRADGKTKARDTAFAMFNWLNERGVYISAGNSYFLVDAPRYIGLDLNNRNVFEFLINLKGEK